VKDWCYGEFARVGDVERSAQIDCAGIAQPSVKPGFRLGNDDIAVIAWRLCRGADGTYKTQGCYGNAALKRR